MYILDNMLGYVIVLPLVKKGTYDFDIVLTVHRDKL